MRRRIDLAALLAMILVLAAAAAASAHGGKSHRVMGTVKAVRVIVATPDGKQTAVEVTPETLYEKAGKRVTGAELKPGARVSIQLTEDDKRAVKVKIGDARAR